MIWLINNSRNVLYGDKAKNRPCFLSKNGYDMVCQSEPVEDLNSSLSLRQAQTDNFRKSFSLLSSRCTYQIVQFIQFRSQHNFYTAVFSTRFGSGCRVNGLKFAFASSGYTLGIYFFYLG
jgi:hypothetical protein